MNLMILELSINVQGDCRYSNTDVLTYDFSSWTNEMFK